MNAHIKSLFSAAALCGFTFVAAHAADVKIIANPSMAASAITLEEVKRVFLITKTSLADGTHVEPVLSKSGAAHDSFLRDCLGKTDAALQTYYRSLVFTGKGSMPKTLASDADVAAYVGKTQGAIGYVSTGANVSGVKVLELK